MGQEDADHDMGDELGGSWLGRRSEQHFAGFSNENAVDTTWSARGREGGLQSIAARGIRDRCGCCALRDRTRRRLPSADRVRWRPRRQISTETSRLRGEGRMRRSLKYKRIGDGAGYQARKWHGEYESEFGDEVGEQHLTRPDRRSVGGVRSLWDLRDPEARRRARARG